MDNKPPSRDWAKENKTNVKSDKNLLIPWIKTQTALFDVELDNNIDNIVIKNVMFPATDDFEGFNYTVAEVYYERFQDRNYKESTYNKWRFYVMVNTSPLEDVVNYYFEEEVRNKFTANLNELSKKIWKMVLGDHRQDFESVALYYEAVVQKLIELGFNKEMGTKVGQLPYEGWTEENKDKKTKGMQEPPIISIGKLMYRLRKLYKEKNDKTLGFIERKRKEIEDAKKKEEEMKANKRLKTQ